MADHPGLGPRTGEGGTQAGGKVSPPDSPAGGSYFSGGSTLDEGPVVKRNKRAIKTGRDHTGDMSVKKRITWPHKVIYYIWGGWAACDLQGVHC